MSMRDLFGNSDVLCQECNQPFIRHRKDAKFCSKICNNRNWRRRDRLKLKMAEEIIAKWNQQIAAE
jgi:hypothetical protein